MSKISDQTNMLALDAAFESSRASEQWHRICVVAKEI